MPKRKPTKHEDDVLRNIRQPERYDPKAMSIGGLWRMVKCKDGAYVCYEQHLEIIDNLRKNAEINDAQSPHDGIHTCSKGCNKCSRGLKEENARLKAEVYRLTDALNKMTKTPDGVYGVDVKVNFWTKCGSRLPSSYQTFWINETKEGKPSV